MKRDDAKGCESLLSKRGDKSVSVFAWYRKINLAVLSCLPCGDV